MTTALIIFLICVIVLLTVKMFVQNRQHKENRDLAARMIAAAGDAREEQVDLWYNRCEAYRLDYVALEKGMAEQEDNYEQQFLTFTENIEKLSTAYELLEMENKVLQDEVDYHQSICLPDLSAMVYASREALAQSGE